MRKTVHLWRGEKPSPRELERRVRRELGIVRPEGYRLVTDRWGKRVIKVELWRVMEHIAYHLADNNRWRYIPAIIPSIKRAVESSVRGTRVTYEAHLPVASSRHKQYERIVFTTAIVIREGEYVFDSIVAPTLADRIKSIRKKAGLPTRPNLIARTSASDTASTKRTAKRLRGAAPAPCNKITTIPTIKSRVAHLVAALFRD